METLLKDLKHSLRLLRRAPTFTATAVAALALGIGANSAIFSVVYAVLLRPLPYPDAERIVQLRNSAPQGTSSAASVPKFNVWRAQTEVLQDVSAYDSEGPGINLGGGDRPEQVKGIHVSRDFFRLFGAQPQLGRTFTEQEDLPGGARVVVLSNGLWKRRFGSDPHILGKTLTLGGEPTQVIGVLGASFSMDSAPDLFLPFQAEPNSVDQAHYFEVAGRLKPGVSMEQARSALAVAGENFKRQYPQMLGPRSTFTVIPLQQDVVREIRLALLVLMAAVGFVLLIACANVANLLLARASIRSREMAIRAAIGAGRGRIIRQLLTESTILGLVGGVLGLALAYAGLRALVVLSPGNLPRIGVDGSNITLDGTVLGFTLVLSLATGILFGLVPALHATRDGLSTTLNASGTRSGSSAGQNRTRGLLVATEIALAFVLLTGAGLLLRTFAALRVVSPGFDSHNVLTLQTSLTGARYDRTAAISDLARQATERIQALPGAQFAAASSYIPLESGLGLPFIIQGRALGDARNHGGAGWSYVTHQFFDVFRIPIRRGRGFTDQDQAGTPGVVILNEAFAKRYWPNQDPIGQYLQIGPGMGPNFAEPPRQIIGISADSRDGGLNSNPGPQMFVPLPQVRDGVMAMNNRFLPLSWVVRTQSAPLTHSAAVLRVFQDLADLPAARVRSMEQVMAQSTAGDRFNSLLLATFAIVAIVLASIGLYGLMAYTVEQRTLEFGIRLALGADASSLQSMIVRQAMLLALAGVAVGCAAAFALTRLMTSLLYGVTPHDPVVFSTVGLVVVTVAFLSSYLPARRAVRIHPSTALRYQ